MASKRKDRLPAEQKAFWLTYNLKTPKNDFTDYEEAVRCSREGRLYLDSWQVEYDTLRSGERIFILRQGNNIVEGRPGRGIVARGITTSDSYGSDRITFRVDVSIDSVIGPDETPISDPYYPFPKEKSFAGPQFSGCPINQGIFQESEQKWAERFDKQPEVLHAATNERERVMRSILERRAQQKFRNELIEVYGKCVLSGCTTQEALEAAHIMPCAAKGEDHIQNGLLLRADLHLLFDLDLLRIDPNTRKVRLAHEIASGDYRWLDAQSLIENHVAANQRASTRFLNWRFDVASHGSID